MQFSGQIGAGHAFLFLFRYSLMLCFVVFYIEDASPKRTLVLKVFASGKADDANRFGRYK